MGAGAAALSFLAAGVAHAGSLLLGGMFLLTAVALWAKGEEIAKRLDVGPAVDVVEHIEPGASEKEVQEFWTLHQEYLEMKEEKREEARDEIGSDTTGTLNRQ